MREELGRDPIARLFVELRNESQKIAASWIAGGIAVRDGAEFSPHYCFTRVLHNGELVFACDVTGLARRHLDTVINVVRLCEEQFGQPTPDGIDR